MVIEACLSWQAASYEEVLESSFRENGEVADYRMSVESEGP